MPIPPGLKDLHPLDILVLRDLVRFGALTDEQIARRYGDAALSDSRLKLLVERDLMNLWPPIVEGVRVLFPSRLGTRLSHLGLSYQLPNLVHLRHDLAVVDLADHLLAQDPAADWRTERQLPWILGRKAPNPVPPVPGERRHKPDGILLSGGKRIAVELEHSTKDTVRYADICRWYAGETRVDAVHWYVDRESTRDAIKAAIADHALELDIEARVEPFPPGVVVRGWVAPQLKPVAEHGERVRQCNS